MIVRAKSGTATAVMASETTMAMICMKARLLVQRVDGRAAARHAEPIAPYDGMAGPYV
jgi:hypothetical protein